MIRIHRAEGFHDPLEANPLRAGMVQHYEVIPPVHVKPPTLVLGCVTSGARVTRSIRLDASASFHLRSVAANTSDTTVQADKDDPLLYHVYVDVRDGIPVGVFTRTVAFDIDEPLGFVLSVDVLGEKRK